MTDREQQGVPLPEIPAFDQSAGILWSEGESEAIKGYCLAYGNARAAAARREALEEAAEIAADMDHSPTSDIAVCIRALKESSNV